MDPLAQTLTILSSMITPVVLILASGSLIMTTSQRLGRVIDRTRRIADRIREITEAGTEKPVTVEERATLFNLLGRAARRARLLQQAMMFLYLTLSLFVATSVVIGIVDVSNLQYTWIPIALGITGAGLLFYTSLILIADARIASGAVDCEMDFVIQISKQHITAEQAKSLARQT
jgi:hypothetical protein